MSSGLTVKNTFLQLDEDARQKPVPARLLKSSSDPGFDMPDTDNEFEDFSDFRGATDYDKESTAGTTGEDEDGGRECISDPGSMSSSCSNSFTALEKGTAHDNEGSFDWTTAVDAGEFQMSSLREQVERLVLENKRLEESNKQLQDACLAKCSTMPVGPIAAVGTQAAFAAPACFDSCGIDTSQNFMCFAVAMVPQDHLMQPQAHVQMQYSQDCHGGRWGKKSGRARLDSSSSEAAISNSKRTTVMLRNLPNNYSRMMLTDMIDNEGFAGKYDFVYLPMDFSTQACLGYAFVNLMDPADALIEASSFVFVIVIAQALREQC
eukprot:TRINITY_DN1028_c0_g1_i17.p1 TRINITY_DN1028_c0_g1~~TRINITY_DN1028_c0_g1_i17.p1  ORF type:complete len:321 (+),score=60.47 TRINITY_DN1028_c0_g1_i17:81-1043(+)